MDYLGWERSISVWFTLSETGMLRFVCGCLRVVRFSISDGLGMVRVHLA